MEWQPIETAPKDGRYILGCSASYYFPHPVVFAAYHPNAEGKHCWRNAKIGGHKITGLTHWMPLPPPPKD